MSFCRMVLCALVVSGCTAHLPAVDPAVLEGVTRTGMVLTYDLDMGSANGNACEFGLASDDLTATIQLFPGANQISAFELPAGKYRISFVKCYGTGKAYFRKELYPFTVESGKVSFLGKVEIAFKLQERAVSFFFTHMRDKAPPALVRLAQMGRLRSGFADVAIDASMLSVTKPNVSVLNPNTPKEYHAAFNGVSAKVSDCYTQERKANLLLLGKVRFRITYGSGAMKAFERLPERSTFSSGFDACVRQVAQGVKYPKTRSGEFEINAS